MCGEVNWVCFIYDSTARKGFQRLGKADYEEEKGLRYEIDVEVFGGRKDGAIKMIREIKRDEKVEYTFAVIPIQHGRRMNVNVSSAMEIRQTAEEIKNNATFNDVFFFCPNSAQPKCEFSHLKSRKEVGKKWKEMGGGEVLDPTVWNHHLTWKRGQEIQEHLLYRTTNDTPWDEVTNAADERRRIERTSDNRVIRPSVAYSCPRST